MRIEQKVKDRITIDIWTLSETEEGNKQRN